MRLDLAIKYSGLIKRRVVAKHYCERGLIKINGKVGKPSSEVKNGDVLTITMGERVVSLSIDIKQEGKKVSLTYNLIDDGKNSKDDA